jgi:hypothetical protein
VEEPVCSGEPLVSGEPVWLEEPVCSGEPLGSDDPVWVEEPVCSGEPLGSGEPVWVDEPVCSDEPLDSEEAVWVDEPVCSVWLVGSLWLCCAMVLGWPAGASVPPFVVLLLDPAAEPSFGVAAAAPEFAVVDCAVVGSTWDAFERVLKVPAREAAALIVRTFAARARERLDLRELLERAAIMRDARALPPGCWLITLLISESICDPAPIAPGG